MDYQAIIFKKDIIFLCQKLGDHHKIDVFVKRVQNFIGWKFDSTREDEICFLWTTVLTYLSILIFKSEFHHPSKTSLLSVVVTEPANRNAQ